MDLVLARHRGHHRFAPIAPDGLSDDGPTVRRGGPSKSWIRTKLVKNLSDCDHELSDVYVREFSLVPGLNSHENFELFTSALPTSWVYLVISLEEERINSSSTQVESPHRL